MAIADVLADHPQRDTFDAAELQQAIEACRACATACHLCADSDLATNASAMADCIRTCLDCAAICDVTASVLARPTPSGHAWKALVEACIMACRECADECSAHDAECCTTCAAHCRDCVEALEQLLAASS